ncbi:MAG: AAA family ATPase [Methylococcaceae bacterium]|nr:AAA family ATPase [Methylococcaceae bacterium]MCI0733060.1 AAA family ATPase [Methylococcaceae bacterium]
MHDKLNQLIETAGRIVLGKENQIRLALCCILAKGHLLIEDIPGVGKTTLAHTLARLFGLHFQRIQFTSDLLPADILGSNVFDARNHAFEFHPGPIFSEMILADEINRSPPKAQSALLEAMEERQVTIDGETHRLPKPFFVIATQNPNEQIGTFPLPESQLDRFLMKIELGYPDRQAERSLLQGAERHRLIESLPVCLPAEQLQKAQATVCEVHSSEAILDYLQSILAFSRGYSEYPLGLSPRAGLALLSASKARAFLEGRDFLLPEDIQSVIAAVAGHRLRTSESGNVRSASVVAPILEGVAIP